MTDALYRTDLPLPNRRQGKVRDIYDLPPGTDGRPRLLIVATDRLSAYDVVMPTPFPGKGRLLTEISTQWFKWIEAATSLAPGSAGGSKAIDPSGGTGDTPRQSRGLMGVAHHVLNTDAGEVPVPPAEQERLRGSIMVCRKVRIVPIECVARGYLAGSGWKEYRQSGSVCGVSLPPGLKQCDRLPEPIFTPATKEEVGHDINITFEQAGELVGHALMARLRDLTLEIYRRAHEYALHRGIIIADTKFEFGHALDADGRSTEEVLLVDEVLTPDSSRFWPADRYEPGRDQESFDKQYVRNYLETLVADGRWDKTPPGPEIPDEIVRNTIAKYRESKERLFG